MITGGSTYALATGEVTHRSVQGLFLLLGAEPPRLATHTVALDDRGFVLTGRDIPRERWATADRPRPSPPPSLASSPSATSAPAR